MQMNAEKTVQPPVVRTQRLVIRPIAPDDAGRVHALAGDWQVARMLADMPHPLNLDLAARWTRAAAGERCLAVTLDGAMIGSVSACVIADGDVGEDGLSAVELGFWLGRRWWGYGFAREAAGAVVASIAAERAASSFKSGHFVDNPASERVLAALGFAPVGKAEQWCVARQETVPAVRYALACAGAAPTPASYRGG